MKILLLIVATVVGIMPVYRNNHCMYSVKVDNNDSSTSYYRTEMECGWKEIGDTLYNTNETEPYSAQR